MFAKYCFSYATAVLSLALLAAGGCEAPQPGAKPLFADLFAPPPATATKPAKPFGSGAQAARTTNPEVDVTIVPTRDDITAVYQFFTQDPWLRNTEGRVTGFTSAVYFHSGATEKGAFVPGKSLMWLYQFERQPDGQLERKLVTVWELTEQEAMGYRVRRQSQMGYSYGFFYTWPSNVDLSGKTVEIMFGYERLDGKLITGAARRFRVPQSRFSTSPPGPVELPRAAPPAPPGRPESRTPTSDPGSAPERQS